MLETCRQALTTRPISLKILLLYRHLVLLYIQQYFRRRWSRSALIWLRMFYQRGYTEENLTLKSASTISTSWQQLSLVSTIIGSIFWYLRHTLASGRKQITAEYWRTSIWCRLWTDFYPPHTMTGLDDPLFGMVVKSRSPHTGQCFRFYCSWCLSGGLKYKKNLI